MGLIRFLRTERDTTASPSALEAEHADAKEAVGAARVRRGWVDSRSACLLTTTSLHSLVRYGRLGQAFCQPRPAPDRTRRDRRGGQPHAGPVSCATGVAVLRSYRRREPSGAAILWCVESELGLRPPLPDRRPGDTDVSADREAVILPLPATGPSCLRLRAGQEEHAFHPEPCRPPRASRSPSCNERTQQRPKTAGWRHRKVSFHNL
jgi:hypothetical protein